MVLTVGPWACAGRAVDDTTATLNTIAPRTRQATPSPRTSHLQNFIPYTPFVVPIGFPDTQAPTRKVVSSSPPSKDRANVAACNAFSWRRINFLRFGLFFFRTLPDYDAVHCAARCKMSL